MKPIIIMVFLSGCGNALIDTGTYNVHITFTKDDWSPVLPDDMDVLWVITEDHGDYKLILPGYSNPIRGHETGGHVLLEEHKEDSCGGIHFQTILHPGDNNREFYGTGVSKVGLCDRDLTTEVNLYSTKHTEL